MRTRTDAAGTVNYEWNPDGTLAVAKDLSKANLDIRYKWTGGLLTGVDYAGSATRAGMKRLYGYDPYGRLTVDKLYLDPAYGPIPPRGPASPAQTVSPTSSVSPTSVGATSTVPGPSAAQPDWDAALGILRGWQGYGYDQKR